uniref:Uncharacterized protein n=1 Tax=Arion vulgaris TaxID=1028688 RepID=A0A0B7BN03_9EUPU
MDYKSAHGKDNSGYQGEETALPIVSNDNELKKETLSDGQLNYIKDINIELNKTSTFDETEHYPNGNVDDHNNDQDLVLQKKEFDLQNANCYSRGIMFVQRSIIDFYNTHNGSICYQRHCDSYCHNCACGFEQSRKHIVYCWLGCFYRNMCSYFI